MPSPARRVISNDLLGGALTLRTSLFFATNYFTLSGRDHHCIFLEQFFELVQYTFGGGPNQSIEVGQIELTETSEVPAAFSTPLLRRDWHIGVPFCTPCSARLDPPLPRFEGLLS
jgi:hypothetical protein